jgi:hypothetical protein
MRKDEMARFEIIFGRGHSMLAIYVQAETKKEALQLGREYSEKFLGGKKISAGNQVESE